MILLKNPFQRSLDEQATWLLASTIMALAHYPGIIERLSLPDLTWHDFHVYEQNATRCEDLIDQTSKAFCKVKELEFEVSAANLERNRFLDAGSRIFHIDGRLAQHLSQAINLVTLRLHVDLDDLKDILQAPRLFGSDDFCRTEDQDAVFKVLYLPHLKNMWATAFNMRRQTFFDWTKKHSSTLRQLECMQSWLSDKEDPQSSAWEHVLKELAPLLRLDHVNLGFMLDEAIKESI